MDIAETSFLAPGWRDEQKQGARLKGGRYESQRTIDARIWYGASPRTNAGPACPAGRHSMLCPYQITNQAKRGESRVQQHNGRKADNRQAGVCEIAREAMSTHAGHN